MVFSEMVDRYLATEADTSRTLGEFPYYTRNASWETLDSSGRDDWVAGFWPGTLWMGASVDDHYRSIAEEQTREISTKLKHNFNIGFRHQYSWVSQYEATGSEEALARSRQAVDRLLDCFHPKISMVGHRTRDHIHVSATDAMMNLPLLMWSYHRGYRAVRCRWVIERTIAEAIDQFIRDDGGVYHLIEFDGRTGEVQARRSPQGYPGGCWSRGLAWMAAGLTLGGLAFNRTRWLSEARALLAYHWKESSHVVPPYDYDVPSGETVPRDTSAGAILASTLCLLGRATDGEDFERQGRFMLEHILDHYLRQPEEDGLIGGGSYHVPEETGVHEATIWGDFYTMEALYLQERDHLPPHLNWLNVA